ncbi:hypothetical protein Cch02nite_28960 [Catellatospora chokoriensis]|uniref:Uncharacterized protein n=1 Tax=Catellatospora chokoriensis TaxID=310353 RepID=A0A8J3JZ02_9ACTN|nr:hypothetical protein Cch02nite_28960 [Catellatospora chokoriensis]
MCMASGAGAGMAWENGGAVMPVKAVRALSERKLSGNPSIRQCFGAMASELIPGGGHSETEAGRHNVKTAL